VLPSHWDEAYKSVVILQKKVIPDSKFYGRITQLKWSLRLINGLINGESSWAEGEWTQKKLTGRNHLTLDKVA
jgi:hypothetical protein